MRKLIQAVLWNRRDPAATERCELWSDPGGFSFVGTVQANVGAVAVDVKYLLVCSVAWHTRFVRILLEEGEHRDLLELTADDRNRWRRNGEELPEFQGHEDVDFGFSPSTNTLPIRRLNLGVGESAAVTSVWVRFPELTLHSLPQRYTRTGERTYQYESRDGQFTAELAVDADGLVVSYGDYWTRVRATRSG